MGEAGTALVACRRAAHASQLVASAVDGACLTFGARRLQYASAAARELLARWRRDLVRPAVDPSVARRLIHGSLHTQIPLPHLVDERNRRAAQKAAQDPGVEASAAASCGAE